MPELEWIRSSLADRMPAKVARATGLHVNTIARIRDGKETNPKLETLNRLALYLRGRA
jgi:transcriptional regulator with XRE-family HTH domain